MLRRTLAIQLPEAVQHPALQLRHFLGGQALAVAETLQVAQQETQGVSQTPVGVALILEDLLADTEVFLVVRGNHPEAQDIGPLGIQDILRRDYIAQGFGHLATLLVEDKAVGKHRLVGRMRPRVPADSKSDEWNQPRC